MRRLLQCGLAAVALGVALFAGAGASSAAPAHAATPSTTHVAGAHTAGDWWW